MSRFRQRQSESSRLAAERRRREDGAPRLVQAIPLLESLSIEVEERRGGSVASESKYVRHFLLPQASSRFELPCMDSECEDGGHDITDGVLRALRSGSTYFEGEDSCNGHLRTANCTRVIHWVTKAKYRAPG